MHCKLHRVASNAEGWRRPTAGRLGVPDVGPYVAKDGFGHEDWNFNFGLARNGIMFGYTVAVPAQKYWEEEIRLVLATFSAGTGWHAVGYYDGATYTEVPKAHAASVIEQMATDVFQLAQAGSLSDRYNNMTRTQITSAISAEFSYFSWQIPIEKVVVFTLPVPIAPSIFSPGTQRMKTPNNISEAQFYAISGSATPIFFTENIPDSFEEGGRSLRLHSAIERNQRLIGAFKRNLASFACTVCGFDFEMEYGDVGKGFIECHHTRPVSEMNSDGDATSISELVAVCSNCHRMLHRERPLITVDALRKMLHEAKN